MERIGSRCSQFDSLFDYLPLFKKNEGDKIFHNLLFDIRTKAVSCPPREELFPSDNRDELLCD